MALTSASHCDLMIVQAHEMNKDASYFEAVLLFTVDGQSSVRL